MQLESAPRIVGAGVLSGWGLEAGGTAAALSGIGTTDHGTHGAQAERATMAPAGGEVGADVALASRRPLALGMPGSGAAWGRFGDERERGREGGLREIHQPFAAPEALDGFE
jgi:hypothetical protein